MAVESAVLRGTDAEYPHLIVSDQETFYEFIGDAPPCVYLVQDGQEIKHWDEEYFTLDELRLAWHELR